MKHPAAASPQMKKRAEIQGGAEAGSNWALRFSRSAGSVSLSALFSQLAVSFLFPSFLNSPFIPYG